MVYLLHRYFGRDGREEAESLLARRSGDADNPRILGAFNEPTPTGWLLYVYVFLPTVMAIPALRSRGIRF